MIRLRNITQYRQAEQRVADLQTRLTYEQNAKLRNELLALGAAMDEFELSRMEPRSR